MRATFPQFWYIFPSPSLCSISPVKYRSHLPYLTPHFLIFPLFGVLPIFDTWFFQTNSFNTILLSIVIKWGKVGKSGDFHSYFTYHYYFIWGMLILLSLVVLVWGGVLSLLLYHYYYYAYYVILLLLLLLYAIILLLLLLLLLLLY